jgi:hypothetical protein
MKYELIESKKGEIAKAIFQEKIVVSNIQMFFELIMESPSDTIVINKTNIADDFFKLSTGFAGEILQKVTNYRKKIIILGDFSNCTSKSLSAFIYESNKNGKVIFSENIEKAIELLL